LESLVSIARDLSREVGALSFGLPVVHVYNPLDYAWGAHRDYLERFGTLGAEVVLLGMNPGPWGMAQTGIPFGEISIVKDWLEITQGVEPPDEQHPRRPIQGFTCARSEVSGSRLWGWARDRFGTPERFFARFLVLNYCPLSFLEESGRNRTPDRLPACEREPLFAACDRALARSVDALSLRWVVGIGNFAMQRAEQALEGQEVSIGRILHPSPASPAANRGWRDRAESGLTSLGIDL